MSKTLKLNVTFPMTIILSTETIAELEVSRDEARKVPQEKVDALKGKSKYRIGLFRGDTPTEKLVEAIYRSGIREFIKKDLLKEITGDEATGRMGDVKVTFEVPMVPRSCDRCIEVNCVKSEKNTNSGCTGKRTGIREPGPRWTETV